MASGIYNHFKTAVLTGSYILSAAAAAKNVYVALMNNSYTFDPDTHDYIGQFIGTYQIAGTNYVAGGHALSTPSVAEVQGSDYGRFDAADWTLGTATLTARYAILYSSTGSGFAADPLIACVDFGEDKTASAGNFTIAWDGNGIMYLT